MARRAERVELDIVHRDVEAYLTRVAAHGDPILEEMERLADERDFPIIGPLVGRLLCQWALALGAKRVLELGSGYGYSAYWFARGLGPGGQVICTERSADNVAKARDFFRRAGLLDRARFETGDALEILDRLPGDFDIILNDVDKVLYPTVFRKALPRIRKGGLLISDNIIWGGTVVHEAKDDATRAIQEYTRLVYGSPDLSTTIIPLRDGVAVSLKLR